MADLSDMKRGDSVIVHHRVTGEQWHGECVGWSYLSPTRRMIDVGFGKSKKPALKNHAHYSYFDPATGLSLRGAYELEVVNA